MKKELVRRFGSASSPQQMKKVGNLYYRGRGPGNVSSA
jgi:hypothetical protein